MDNSTSRLQKGWWSFALPGYRDHLKPATYSLFSYDGLPPIEVPGDRNWEWLQAQPRQEEWSLADNGYSDGTKPDLSNLTNLVTQSPFEFPDQFISFMQNPALHERIRSSTACMLELSDYLVITTNPPDGVLIQFLVDQQGCLRWYLFTDRAGSHCVLVTGETYGFAYNAEENPPIRVDLFKENIWFCAPTFSDFIYRFWLENEIFFGLTQKPPALTHLQSEYVSHYK